MRAIQLAQPKQFEQIEVPTPSRPEPGEAIVRTHRMGICGTDVSCYLGKFPFFAYPRIPGHELGVEVLAIGEGVAHLAVGDRCSVEPYMNCGICFACRRGAINCCAKLSVIGVMENGGLCESFRVRASKLHRSDKLSYDQLALVETLAIGCHASYRADSQPGDHVLIIGAGPIGLATLEFVRLTGATISVMDRIASRLAFCQSQYGVKHTIEFTGDGSEVEQMNQITNCDRYPVVIDATGNPRSMSGALQFCAQSGVLVYVGITTEEISFKHPALHRPEVTLKASRNALPEDFTRIIGLIEDGTIRTNPWITHRTTFDRVASEFDSLSNPETGVLKAIIDVT
jgi:alcohol dehydrogenase